MRPLRTIPGALALLLALAAIPATLAPAQAGLDVDFGAAVRVGDDADLYLNISTRYFDRDRPTIDRFAARFVDPDDLTVALFISRHSGRDADALHRLRRQGLSWWDISLRLGVPADAWFVAVPNQPGPPYGKAYGHWKKHRRHPEALVLTDTDLRHLAAVRVLHEYYDVPVEVAMAWRSDGTRIDHLAAGEYDRRHGRSERAEGKGSRRGNDHGKGHGKGKSKH